jgi:hypothetical protein
MGSEIVKSRWRYVKTRIAVPAFIAALGIEFRKVAGQSFWDSNRFILPDLYRQMLDESRDKLRELHPDTGGDGKEFDDFIQSLSQAKKAFARQLNIEFGKKLPPNEASLTIVPRRGQNQFGFYRTDKVFRAIEMMRGGKADREIQRLLGMHFNTTKKIKRIVNGVINGCECGKPRGHKGWCRIMMKKSPSRQALMRRFHENQRKQAA